VTRKRSTSGASGLLSKFPFMRSSSDHHRPRSRTSIDEAHPEEVPTPVSPTRGAPTSMSNALQQQQVKTRRRRGSLRKVALLGRGAQRERTASRTFSAETKQAISQSLLDGATDAEGYNSSPLGDGDRTPSGNTRMSYDDGYGLGISGGISDITPRPSMDGYASRSVSGMSTSSGPATQPPRGGAGGEGSPAMEPISIPKETRPLSTDAESILTSPKSPTISYSTTDDEDALHMSGGLRPGTPSLPRPDRSSMSSGSDSYFPGIGTTAGSTSSHVNTSIQRRRSATIQRAKSPLALTSLAGLSTTPLPQQETDWDYSETEWWGWVVLVVTWVVFVIGMGSCLGVWSWAWDVGTTPYAPPELEDDPTLPIVGYYPALIILTGVMAWVWVVVAWVGMKYFRHARVSGD
jgi:hypothetical protein